MKGLARYYRSRVHSKLTQLIMDPFYYPTSNRYEEIYHNCKSENIELLVNFRADFIDAISKDLRDPNSLFHDEVLSYASMLIEADDSRFVEEFTHWWEEYGEYQRKDHAWKWLVNKLWDVDCLKAAEEVALRSKSSELSESANLALLIDKIRHGKLDKEAVMSEAWTLCLLPTVSDVFGMLHIDSDLMNFYGNKAIAKRLKKRQKLIDFLYRLWEEQKYDTAREVPWLLYHLFDKPD